MAKFAYKMQNILNIKYRLEDQAKQQFATAQNRLNEEEAHMSELQNRKLYYLKEGVEIRQNSLTVLKMKENEYALKRADEDIKAQQLQVKLAQRNLENARVKLAEAAVERKTHEKLRENAFEVFLKDLNASEMKEIDELTSYTYGRNKE